MPENREFIVTLEMSDAVSPILRAIEALAPLCSSINFVMPSDPVDVVTMPGSTTAMLVPSERLLALLVHAANDVRQRAAAAANRAANRAALAKLTPAERQNRAAAN